ncbi:MAG TPA: PH domain-containing protein [Roseiflexaceae bacterium]|nr:PH domain-containing protein [Roseiflexaceae bacterium]HMP39858.1 PH domain-containing protein [Roseiflexaceae bacterium]
MAYVDELLGRGETVRYTARRHLFVLISSILTELLLIGLLIAAGVTSQMAFPNRSIAGQPVGQVIMVACVIISLIVLLSAVLDYFRWNGEVFVITDMRVILVRGIFNKEVLDSSLEKINDVELRQSWIGRVFDFGDIEILTGADSGVNLLPQIARPLEFKRMMLDAKHDFTRGYNYFDDAPSVAAYVKSNAPNQVGDIQQTLQKLADLRDQGLLSSEEFEAKKRELLSRI